MQLFTKVSAWEMYGFGTWTVRKWGLTVDG